MPLDLLIFNWTLALDEWFLSGVPAAVQGGLAWVRGPLRAALGLYVIIHALEMVLADGSARKLGFAVARALCVLAILESANYVTYVQNAFLTDLPAQGAAALNGPRIEANAARQFDVLRSALGNFKALILMRSPGWTGIADRGVAHLIGWVATFGVVAMWVPWYVPRLLTGIVVCLGPFVLATYLFSATRAIGFTWVGKLVSLLMLQLAASVLVRLLLSTITRRMEVLQSANGATVDLMLDNFGAMALLMWFGALLMWVLPAAITFGSGIGRATNSIIAGATGAAMVPVRAAVR